jgi:peptidoglycan hydrolase-like protein with peptidoglycan-binding domain
VNWQIVKAERLPFGKRILRRGCQGDDVAELQQRLAAIGFYFGTPDGSYGILTEEAVSRLQQTFKLRQDGIAGPAVVTALAQNPVRAGRIIYTVKPGDSLAQISARFGVAPGAWRSVPGNQPGVKRIYPGQQLLLYQKALFTWDETSDMQTGATSTVTGIIESKPVVAIGEDTGHPNRQNRNSRFCLLKLNESIGVAGQPPPEVGVQLARQLPTPPDGKIGLDFGAGPTNTLLFRDGWVIKWLRALGRTQLSFALLPLVMTPCGEERLFWAQLDWVSRYARLIMVEPVWDESTTDNFQATVEQWQKVLPKFARLGGRKPLLLVISTHAWNWDEDQVLRRVAFSEVKQIRALYNQSAVAVLAGRLAMMRYRSQGKQQWLLYRERDWWERLLQQVVKYNFAGLVIREFGALGEDGPELIAAAFRVLPESLLRSLDP